MYFRNHGDDEFFCSFDLALLDILSHSMESIFITILLHEEEFILLLLKHPPTRGELEEDRIECELESVFPLLDLLIFCSSSIE